MAFWISNICYWWLFLHAWHLRDGIAISSFVTFLLLYSYDSFLSNGSLHHYFRLEFVHPCFSQSARLCILTSFCSYFLNSWMHCFWFTCLMCFFRIWTLFFEPFLLATVALSCNFSVDLVIFWSFDGSFSFSSFSMLHSLHISPEVFHWSRVWTVCFWYLEDHAISLVCSTSFSVCTLFMLLRLGLDIVSR